MSQTVDIKELNERIEQKSAFVQTLVTGMDRVIVGQKQSPMLRIKGLAK